MDPVITFSNKVNPFALKIVKKTICINYWMVLYLDYLKIVSVRKD